MNTWCNKYIKIPFKECGRDENGCDCWGLTRLIYRDELGIDLPMLMGYSDTHDRNKISDLYETEHLNWKEIPLNQEKEFDIIIFRTMGLPTHVGIVIGNGFMIHCERSIGTCISNYKKELLWKKRIVGVYRYESSKITTSF